MASASRRLVDPVLLAILCGALLLRLGYPALVGLAERTPLHGFVVDEQEYYGAASVLADGRGLSFYDTFTWTRTPAYVILVATLFGLFGRQTGPVFALQAVLSVLTLYLLAWLAGRAARRAPALGLSPRAAARGAALLGALWLPFTLFANLLLSETLFLLLIAGAFVLLAGWADRAPDTGGARPDPTPPASPAAREPRLRFVLPLAAGALLGLAALTRSTALAFIPLVALWAGWTAWRQGGWRRPPWPAPGLLLAGAILLLLPQVGYNYVAYRQLILGDTSSGYNLWLASVGVKDAARLEADLARIPSPADKQAFAYQQALANIAARPGDFLGKGLKESLDLWKINFASEERQVRGFSAGRVPAAHLWSLLAGEDLLYILIVLLGLLGLAASPPDPLPGLVGLWALTWALMAFIFFAVTRFRFPVIALLLPWAPLGAAYIRHLLPRRRQAQAGGPVPRPSWKSAALFGLGALFLLVVGPTLPWSETVLGATQWGRQQPYRAALPLIGGADSAAALALLRQADPAIPDTQFAVDA
ncbi:MAG TPA: hypothetical protein VKY74_01150, partial [Chloroflexia bacterium]|nr:hypothetical protein [Chloroflexia bacterium]